MDAKIIDDTISHLVAARDHLAKLGKLEEAHAKSSAEFESHKAELSRVQGELENAKSGLSQAQVKNLRDYEEAVFTKSQQVKDLDAKIALALAQLNSVNVHLTSAATRHKQIEDSIASLRARLG